MHEHKYFADCIVECFIQWQVYLSSRLLMQLSMLKGGGGDGQADHENDSQGSLLGGC